jgi:phenylacetate-CoA ligase
VDPREDVIDLFQRTAATVPAYRAFLDAHDVNPDQIRTFHDFSRLPLTDKDTYTRKYPLPELCRDGVLGEMVAVSSGSSGEPSFWPRSSEDEALVTDRFEQVFRDAFQARERRTLAVVCFALGTWVGGLFTLACCRRLAALGYPVTTIAPGNDKQEILRVVPRLAPHFDQVVLLGYPPFLKDVIDTGRATGVNWADHHVRLVTAGEVFTEEWRTMVAERAGIADPCRDTASLYGTADAGVLGNETPLSIGIRRFLASRPAAARELFGDLRLPTLVQYDPYARFFEEIDGTLLFSGAGGVPLIRYHIADEGGLIGHAGMLGFLKRYGYTPDDPGPELPFVYVFGRGRFAVSFYGANVFPENVSVGLEQPEVSGAVTGKFVMEVAEDDDHDRWLDITVELAPGQDPDEDLARVVAASVHAQLRRLNSEFAHYPPPDRQVPRVRLRPAGDPEYFPPGVKHRYTRT